MKCPFCDRDLQGPACPECGVTALEGANFCMQCGARLQAPELPSAEEDDLDLEARILCPDGNCTGIMIDGRCSECGRTEDQA